MPLAIKEREAASDNIPTPRSNYRTTATATATTALDQRMVTTYSHIHDIDSCETCQDFFQGPQVCFIIIFYIFPHYGICWPCAPHVSSLLLLSLTAARVLCVFRIYADHILLYYSIKKKRAMRIPDTVPVHTPGSRSVPFLVLISYIIIILLINLINRKRASHSSSRR